MSSLLPSVWCRLLEVLYWAVLATPEATSEMLYREKLRVLGGVAFARVALLGGVVLGCAVLGGVLY